LARSLHLIEHFGMPETGAISYGDRFAEPRIACHARRRRERLDHFVVLSEAGPVPANGLVEDECRHSELKAKWQSHL